MLFFFMTSLIQADALLGALRVEPDEAIALGNLHRRIDANVDDDRTALAPREQAGVADLAELVGDDAARPQRLRQLRDVHRPRRERRRAPVDDGVADLD